MATAKPNPQQIAQQAAAAAKAKNAAIQAPVSNTPPPNMAALQKIAPSVAGDLAKQQAAKQSLVPMGMSKTAALNMAALQKSDLAKEQQAKLEAAKQALAARPQATSLPPPTPPRPIPSAPQDVFDAYGKLLNPGGGMVGYDEGVYKADGTPLNPLVTPPRPGYLQDPNFLNYQKQAENLGLQLKDYMMNSPLYQQQLSLEQAAQAQFSPSGLGQMALLQQSPEFQRYQQQRMDLENQLNAYQQNAPMYKQLQDVMGKMGEIERTTAYAPPFAQPYVQGLASVPQSLEQQQALQQAQFAQAQALPEQQRAMFAAQFQQRQQQLNNAMQGQPNFAQPYVQGLGAMAARPAPKSNPMTGLGAFAANPNIAAANPFATLGVTAGAQQAQQNVLPPYNPMMDTFRGNQQAPASFGQSIGQLFQGLGGQAQTQQSPYAAQQASNLMQNTGQVGQNAYGSFVGQQKPQQQQMQQPMQPQQTAQTAQNSVAPPMQAGFNFFNQDQGQGNTGGGTMGGGGLF